MRRGEGRGSGGKREVEGEKWRGLGNREGDLVRKVGVRMRGERELRGVKEAEVGE